MDTGTIMISLAIATVLTIFTVITGAFRRVLTYAWDLVLTFLLMVVFVLLVLHFVSLLP